MTPANALDLLLIDDEEEIFRPSQPPRGSAGVYNPNSALFNLGMALLRWAVVPPKLAVPLLSAQAKAAGLSVETVCRPTLPWQGPRLRRLLARRPLAAAVTTVAIFDPVFLARITSEIRRLSPGTVIILGGHGAAASAEIRAQGDLWITGHGERRLAEVVLELKKGVPLPQVPGVTAVPGGGLSAAGSLRYEGIPRVLPPDWSAASTLARSYPVEASRGCRFNCAFCDFPGRGCQAFRPAADVAAELAAVRRERGVKKFEFVDSSLTSDPAFVRQLCAEMRAAGLRVKWKCFARPDAFARDAGLAREMAAAGCTEIFMGIESIHDGLLAAMRRGMDRAAVELGLARAFEAGISVHGNFIIGLPGETEATALETAAFVRARPFHSAYFCTFGASREMLDLAAREPARYLNLAGTPVKGWRCDGLDYRGAYGLTLKAVAAVNAGRSKPLAVSPRTNDPDCPPF